MPVPAETTVEVSHKGEVDEHVIEVAIAKVSRVAERSREPVIHIELRLKLEPDPRLERPAIAEATVSIQGTPIRAHVAAATIEESIDLLLDRLKRRIDRHEDRRLHLGVERQRTGDSGPGQWRHGDLPTIRSEFLDVPFDEREVRKHKTFGLGPISVEEAIFDLEQLGHDFYLFVDEATGTDCVITRDLSDEFVLESVEPDLYKDETSTTVRHESSTPPVLSLSSAKELIEASGRAFLLFQAEQQGRGQILYRRLDGHYGLLSPA